MYGLPEPSVASALIAAGARGVIRGGDTDLVTAVTKTVLLLGMTDSVEIGAVVGAGVQSSSAAARANAARRSATDVAVVSPDAPRARPAMLGKVNGERSAALDTRNGGPGYTASAQRPVGMDPIEVERALSALGKPVGFRGPASEPDLRGGGVPTSLVPQQRADLPRQAGGRTPTLTERELQVLRGMSDGMSNAEIGRELFVSEDTVKTHARRLFRKLGARDRAHAVASGFRLGLVG